MYPVSSCDQEVGEDIFNLINELYIIDSKPDLAFENVSASASGIYADCEINVINQGLKNSEQAEVLIYNKDHLIKRIDLDPIDVGEGLKITLKNLRVYNSDELNFIINSSFDELDMGNNKATLEVIK